MDFCVRFFSFPGIFALGWCQWVPPRIKTLRSWRLAFPLLALVAPVVFGAEVVSFGRRLDWQTLKNTRKRGDGLKIWKFGFVFFCFCWFRVSGSSTCQRGEIMWNNMILKLFFARTDATESWLKVKPPSQCLLYYVLVVYLSSTKWHDNLWELSHWYIQIDCHTAIIWRWTPEKKGKTLWVVSLR